MFEVSFKLCLSWSEYFPGLRSSLRYPGAKNKCQFLMLRITGKRKDCSYERKRDEAEKTGPLINKHLRKEHGAQVYLLYWPDSSF